MSRNSTKNKFDFSLYRSYWISTNAFSRFYSAFCVCWLWSFINCAFCYLIFKKSEREREREKEIWKLSKNVLKEISRYFMNNISIFFLQSVFMNDYFFFYSILLNICYIITTCIIHNVHIYNLFDALLITYFLIKGDKLGFPYRLYHSLYTIITCSIIFSIPRNDLYKNNHCTTIIWKKKSFCWYV